MNEKNNFQIPLGKKHKPRRIHVFFLALSNLSRDGQSDFKKEKKRQHTLYMYWLNMFASISSL